MAIQLDSKDFWNRYILTAQHDAGQYLNAAPNPSVLQAALNANMIDAVYRPILFLNWASRCTRFQTRR
jgi:hypothetical protein